MRPSLRPTLLLVLLVLAALAEVPVAGASSLAYLSLEALTQRSEACVVGKVTAADVHWNEARTVIVTTFTVDPAEVLSGEVAAAPFELHRVGGTLDGVTLGYDDMPLLAVGDDAVLFLRERPGGSFIVSGLRQGVLRGGPEGFTRNLRGVAGAPGPVESLPLESIRHRVRAGASASGGPGPARR